MTTENSHKAFESSRKAFESSRKAFESSRKAFENFYHFSPQEIVKIYPAEQKSGFKPVGLYFAPGNSWIEWCQQAGFFPHSYAHKYKLMTSDLNILCLDEDNAEEFFYQYGDDTYPGSLLGHFDWKAVAKEYDGIHIPLSLVETDYEMLDPLICWSVYDVETLVVWTEKITLEKQEFEVSLSLD